MAIAVMEMEPLEMAEVATREIVIIMVLSDVATLAVELSDVEAIPATGAQRPSRRKTTTDGRWEPFSAWTTTVARLTA